jgi:hypothetical protein
MQTDISNAPADGDQGDAGPDAGRPGSWRDAFGKADIGTDALLSGGYFATMSKAAQDALLGFDLAVSTDDLIAGGAVGRRGLFGDDAAAA